MQTKYILKIPNIMKVIAKLINFFIWLYNSIFSSYKHRDCVLPSNNLIFVPKRANQGGSQQEGSLSISVARNYYPESNILALCVENERQKGYNWANQEVYSFLTGAEVRSIRETSNEKIGFYCNFLQCYKGSWAGFWLFHNDPYREVDFEIYDGDRMTCAFHWKDKKGERYVFTNRINIVKHGVFKFKLGRFTKAYINNRLVFMFPKPMIRPYRILHSIYAIKANPVESYMEFHTDTRTRINTVKDYERTNYQNSKRP